MMTVIAYYGTTTTLYRDLWHINDQVHDNSMSWNESGYVEGSGWHTSSIDKNFHIAQHNDRPFVLAKTFMDYDEFVWFTENHEDCVGIKSFK